MIDENLSPFLFNTVQQGTKVQIDGHDKKGERFLFTCTILFVSSRFIRMKIPSDKKIIDYLSKKPSFFVRFQKGQFLFQFLTSPIIIDSFPTYVMQVQIPDRVESFSLRKSKRVKLEMDCQIRFYQTESIKKYPLLNAIIRDISVGGMKIITEAVPLNKFLLIKNIRLPDGSNLNSVDAIIKNHKSTDRIQYLSLQFIYISEKDKDLINFFVLKNSKSSIRNPSVR
jgi:hypothetical protein